MHIEEALEQPIILNPHTLTSTLALVIPIFTVFQPKILQMNLP